MASGSMGTGGIRWLRWLVIGLGTIQTLGIIAVVFLVSGSLSSGEQLARSMGWLVLQVYGIPYLLLVLPGLILAVLDRWLPLAAALCLLALPIAILLMRSA